MFTCLGLSRVTEKEAIEAIAKILNLSPERPDYIVLAVKELWRNHCSASTNTRWCFMCESVRSPGEKHCLDCGSKTEEIT